MKYIKYVFVILYHGVKLLELHKKDKEPIARLLKRKNKTKHLRKFLIQSGSDSGVVIGCDGNYCGH